MSELPLQDIIDSVWGASPKEKRLELPVILWRPPKPEDVEYICDYFYPFLQIMSSDLDRSKLNLQPYFILLPNNWVIYDYTDALSAAVPHFYRKEIHGSLNKQRDEDDEGGSGDGTIIKQQFDAALRMLAIAKERGWSAVNLVDGTGLMKFYAWIAAEELGIELSGFAPTEAQRKRHEIISRERQAAAELRKVRQPSQMRLEQQQTSDET